MKTCKNCKFFWKVFENLGELDGLCCIEPKSFQEIKTEFDRPACWCFEYKESWIKRLLSRFLGNC